MESNRMEPNRFISIITQRRSSYWLIPNENVRSAVIVYLSIYIGIQHILVNENTYTRVFVRLNKNERKANKNHKDYWTHRLCTEKKRRNSTTKQCDVVQKFRKFIYCTKHISGRIVIIEGQRTHARTCTPNNPKEYDDKKQKNIIFPYLNRARNQLKHLTHNTTHYWNWNRMMVALFSIPTTIHARNENPANTKEVLSSLSHHTFAKCLKNNASSEWLIFILWQTILSLQMLLST